MTLLCLSSGPFELLEELAGDVALQASGDLAVGLAFAASTFGVGARGGIGAESSDDDLEVPRSDGRVGCW